MKIDARKPPSEFFPGMVSAREAAQILSVSVRYVRRLRSLGLLTYAVKVHGEFGLMREADVRAYLAGHPKLGTRKKSA